MTEEKEKTAAAPMTFAQMFWRKLREHSTTYRADEPAPVAPVEPPPPEEEPEGEKTVSAEKLFAYTAYMQRQSSMPFGGNVSQRLPARYCMNWNLFGR